MILIRKWLVEAEADLSAAKDSYNTKHYINEFAAKLKDKFNCIVYLFGSFARGEIHEGSDIDLIVVGDFKERFFERIGKIIEMTDLPIEPLVYTKEEFEEMKKSNPFIIEILKNAKKLV